MHIKPYDAIYAFNGGEVESTLRTMVYRYLGNNPEFNVIYRAYNKDGIFRDKDFRYSCDFNKIFPDAQNKQFVYAWTSYSSSEEGSLRLDMNCICPTVVYVNGEIVFKSSIFEERYPERRQELDIEVKKGDNTIVLELQKTPAGFGILFGTWLGKFNLYFDAPSCDRRGQEGFIYTNPLDTPLKTLPVSGMCEADTGVEWLPARSWNDDKNLSRMYGEDGKVLCYTKLHCIFSGKYTLDIDTNCDYKIYLNNEHISSNILSLNLGVYDLVAVIDKKGYNAYFNLTVSGLALVNPCNIWGSDEKFIYAGVFEDDIDIKEAIKLRKPLSAISGKTFWRLDEPGMFIRPYIEHGLFGEWNYPLGVTIYGLLSVARELGYEHILNYVKNHVSLCCNTFDYAIFDRETYGGGTSIHNLLASIDSLDDCGSFGSAMLEVGKYFEIENIRRVADYVADYISNKQVRLDNGVFFRKHLMHIFHEDTMWADDLYMSIPFLCRYYRLTGDIKYMDDAAKQILGFKQYLYMEDKKIFSHVFDFKFGNKTGVPWGRGNGWVMFTMAEFLETLPDFHPEKEKIKALFLEMCEGILNLQDKDGMWHQVLTEHDSYTESSCTAMFVYAFSKGLQNGWLVDGQYIKAAFKGFEALTKYAIDKHGNLFGVCRGSEFSYNSDYYKYELLPRLNDTHGIGIVLLAGTEVLRLRKWLENDNL